MDNPLIGDIWIYAGRMSLRLVIALLRSASCSSMFYLTRGNPEIGPWHSAECKALSINQSVKQKVLRPKLQNRLKPPGPPTPILPSILHPILSNSITGMACMGYRYCVYWRAEYCKGSHAGGKARGTHDKAWRSSREVSPSSLVECTCKVPSSPQSLVECTT